MEGSAVQHELAVAPGDMETLRANVAEGINNQIKLHKESGRLDTNVISDGYHSFGELYDHRIELYIALCRTLNFTKYVWRSEKHHDGSSFEGWFIMSIEVDKDKQISYHLPMDKWEDCRFATTLPTAPEWDGHTSADVLKRLKTL